MLEKYPQNKLVAKKRMDAINNCIDKISDKIEGVPQEIRVELENSIKELADLATYTTVFRKTVSK